MIGSDTTILASLVARLPTVNAALNATAALLLVVGWVLIKRGHERAHKQAMLAAFGTSIVFLACYLVYHAVAGHVEFRGPSPVREVYLGILLTHVVLAAAVPVLAILTIRYGLTEQREKHRRLARWTFPIWMYVSITGVVVYLMLYHLYR